MSQYKKKTPKQSSSFMAVSRSQTIQAKQTEKGKGYNTDIVYNVKDDYTKKNHGSPFKYCRPEEIPFSDSRFDIFYNQDKMYTTTMLLDHEASGGEFNLIKPNQVSTSKSQKRLKGL
jgi:hypothetical protein